MEKVSIKPDWVRGDCIGKGAFGKVSVAANKADGRVFAVKSVELSLDSTCQAEALENEIRILRSLSSPYVVEYLGDDTTCEQGAAACRNLHMECLPGGTAAELGAGVDERSLRSYTWCVLSALRYVHGKGIVHCDVKGRNVLLGSGPGSAKLADFGSAVELGSGVSPRGSPLWMAPEVIRGEYQGPESDVWSLGCTVIEMFTGKPAWEDRGVNTLCRIGYSSELPELPTRLSELGRDFVGKCLRREVSERWSCDQLLQHPFVASCSPPSLVSDDWSPRCVLDSFDSNYSDEEEDQQTFDETDAKERIGKLASNAGANWESDGWMVVRNLIDEEEEREGTSSEYHELVRTEEGSCRRSSEYSDAMPTGEVSGGTNWEYCYSNGLSMEEADGFGAGSSYAIHGPNKEEEGLSVTAVEMMYIDSHSTIKNHLFSYNKSAILATAFKTCGNLIGNLTEKLFDEN
ncbi:hypothetical protein RJ639_018953 [Escallonia herrerae]|uniref:Protein kinase domain-containing protein n=1 Tax=Escallonia herrerae TaxID=1293975 RepID=A0AA89AHF2_9ASTE|nr:hypothetical protein RJ639_018953 [Escallonia herrerae]